MNKKPVVCFVINSLGGGGAERVFSRLVNLLNETALNFNIVIITLDDDVIANPIDDGIEHISLDCAGSLLKSMLLLRKVISTVKPDVVLSFLTRANVASVFSCSRNKTPVIISERVNTTSHFGTGYVAKVKKQLVQYFYNKSKYIVAVSDGVRKDLIDYFKVEPEKIVVIGNSYSSFDLNNKAAEYQPEFEDGSYIVCVGRFYQNKNHQLLIRALAKVKNPKKLMFLGDGPEMQNIKDLVSELSLQDVVIFKGFINNPYPYIKRSSGLISASLAEGFPNVIAEALVYGKFVVSSDCKSGPSELLNLRVREEGGVDSLLYGKFGVLIPVNDCVSTAQGLELFNDPSIIKSYEVKTSGLADNFSHETFINSFVNIIQKGLQAK